MTAPTNAGTYTVVATFTSSNPSYSGGSTSNHLHRQPGRDQLHHRQRYPSLRLSGQPGGRLAFEFQHRHQRRDP